MKIYRMQRTQDLPMGLDQAWQFFSDPRNLGQITPPSLGFRMTSPDSASEIHAGMIITYRINPLPLISLDWVTEITQAQRPHFFIDEQRFGPYRFWHHQHRFEETEAGVRCTDLVHYALPFGPLGRAAHGLMVRGRLRQIFEYRRQALAALFESPARAAPGRSVSPGLGNHQSPVV